MRCAALLLLCFHLIQNSVHQAINKELAKARDEAEKQAHERNARCSLLEAQLRDSQEEKEVLSEQVCTHKHNLSPFRLAQVGRVALSSAGLLAALCIFLRMCQHQRTDKHGGHRSWRL